MNDKLKQAIGKLKDIREVAKTYGVVTISEGDSRAIDTVVAELEKPTYTVEDMEAFFLWASDNGWFYGKLTEMWHNYAEIDINADYDTSKRYSIDDLVKIWEQQRKEATE